MDSFEGVWIFLLLENPFNKPPRPFLFGFDSTHHETELFQMTESDFVQVNICFSPAAVLYST